MTYEEILTQMLKKVPDRYDKREGSVIMNALGPAAAELLLCYMELDRVLDAAYADTAPRDCLIRRAAERGVYPKLSTNAERRAVFNIEVPTGTRFAAGDVTFRVMERMEDGGYRLICEEPGIRGNAAGVPLTPIDYVSGLNSALLTDILTPGEDPEDTESIRKRYFDSTQSQPFGGNIADYREKALMQPGIGGAKVLPLWAGPGTVKVLVQSALFGTPDESLVKAVQEVLDPMDDRGLGLGLAPIGHVCTVAGVTGLVINASFSLVIRQGSDRIRILEDTKAAVDRYFGELSADWSGCDRLIARISQLETRVLEVPGVIDVSGTKLNSAAANLMLAPEQIPVRGQVSALFA